MNFLYWSTCIKLYKNITLCFIGTSCMWLLCRVKLGLSITVLDFCRYKWNLTFRSGYAIGIFNFHFAQYFQYCVKYVSISKNTNEINFVGMFTLNFKIDGRLNSPLPENIVNETEFTCCYRKSSAIYSAIEKSAAFDTPTKILIFLITALQK